MPNSDSRQEYMRRIHQVQDYIETHLEEPMPIETLAQVAGFSKYHFDRIFKGLLNEPLSHYVTRLKLTKAAQVLSYRPDISITEIAYRYGFTDSAVFSRSFKAYFQQSPSSYRNQNSKNCKEPLKISTYNEEVSKRTKTSSAPCLPVSVDILSGKEINFPAIVKEFLLDQKSNW